MSTSKNDDVLPSWTTVEMTKTKPNEQDTGMTINEAGVPTFTSSTTSSTTTNTPTNTSTLPPRKMGHNFCFLCCDMRLTVIIISCLLIAQNGLMVLVPTRAVTNTIRFVFAGVDLGMASMALYGAVTYRFRPIFIKAIYQLVYYIILSLVLNHQRYDKAIDELDDFYSDEIKDQVRGRFRTIALVTGALFGLLMAYPHLVLAWLIRRGIMTPARYSSYESHCCCGNSTGGAPGSANVV